MKKSFFVGAALLTLAGCAVPPQPVYVPPPPPKPVVIDGIDRFTGIRKITWENKLTGPNLGFFAAFLVVADKQGSFRTSKPAIVLTTSSREWKYLKCHNTYWLADGKRVEPISVRHDGTTYSGGVVEQITSDFSVAAFQQLAAAQTVEYRVCNKESYLYASEMEGLKQVAQRMSAALAGSAAPEPMR